MGCKCLDGDSKALWVVGEGFLEETCLGRLTSL